MTLRDTVEEYLLGFRLPQVVNVDLSAQTSSFERAAESHATACRKREGSQSESDREYRFCTTRTESAKVRLLFGQGLGV